MFDNINILFVRILQPDVVCEGLYGLCDLDSPLRGIGRNGISECILIGEPGRAVNFGDDLLQRGGPRDHQTHPGQARWNRMIEMA